MTIDGNFLSVENFLSIKGLEATLKDSCTNSEDTFCIEFNKMLCTKKNYQKLLLQ